MTNYEYIMSLSIEEYAKTRVKEYTADHCGGYTYYCGDFKGDCEAVFQCTAQAYEEALRLEIEWLNSEKV